MAGHIDTHHHFLPKIFLDTAAAEQLARVTPNGVAPTWSAEAAIAMMDSVGIEEGILSIPFPATVDVARRCNEFAADLRSKHPGRFGSFASLPLQNIESSLDEIGYCLDTLEVDGFVLLTNYAGKYLGETMFVPIMEELNRRKAVVFVHPIRPPYTLENLPPDGVLEFTFDTTRTAASLMLAGALKRWPHIKFILSHAGGTLPYLFQRLAGMVKMNPPIAERVGDVDEAIRAFWYDTALSVSKPQLAALLSVADPARILFGTDFPFVPPVGAEGEAKGLIKAPLQDELRAAIFRGNAARLLGRVTA